MYTQCPACLAVFSLDAQTLAEAGGQVQCAHCQEVFDALISLTSQLPPKPFRTLDERAASGTPPVLELAVYRPPPEPPEEPPASAEDHRQDFSQLKFTPRFARGRGPVRERPAPRPRRRRGPWVVACLVLALLLLLQLGWVQRRVLLTDPTAGPWLRRAWTMTGLRLPLLAAPARLALTARDVEPNPQHPGSLLVSARVRNEAPFAQPFPIVTLMLSDRQGRTLAVRRLRPEAYLADPSVQRRGLAAGATASLLIDMADPGGQVSSFEFSFQ